MASPTMGMLDMTGRLKIHFVAVRKLVKMLIASNNVGHGREMYFLY